MTNNPITLGALIRAIEDRQPKPDTWICFDFGGFYPDGVDSYRGYYEMLAIGYQSKRTESNCLAATLLEDLYSAIGRTFHGYKGGEFRMHENTLMWAANYGECNSTAVIGLADCDYQIILATAFCENPTRGNR